MYFLSSYKKFTPYNHVLKSFPTFPEKDWKMTLLFQIPSLLVHT